MRMWVKYGLAGRGAGGWLHFEHNETAATCEPAAKPLVDATMAMWTVNDAMWCMLQPMAMVRVRRPTTVPNLNLLIAPPTTITIDETSKATAPKRTAINDRHHLLMEMIEAGDRSNLLWMWISYGR